MELCTKYRRNDDNDRRLYDGKGNVIQLEYNDRKVEYKYNSNNQQIYSRNTCKGKILYEITSKYNIFGRLLEQVKIDVECKNIEIEQRSYDVKKEGMVIYKLQLKEDVILEMIRLYNENILTEKNHTLIFSLFLALGKTYNAKKIINRFDFIKQAKSNTEQRDIYSEEREYDDNRNLIHFKNSEGFESFTNYDDRNNKVLYQSIINGEIEKYQVFKYNDDDTLIESYDKQSNIIKKYDKNGEILYHNDRGNEIETFYENGIPSGTKYSKEYFIIETDEKDEIKSIYNKKKRHTIDFTKDSKGLINKCTISKEHSLVVLKRKEDDK